MSTEGLDLSERRDVQVVAISAVVTFLAALTVVCRFISRKMKGASWAVDDWLVIFSLVLILCLLALCALGTNHGLGRHAALPGVDVAGWLKVLYVFQIFYVMAPASIKLSLLFLYKRIFVGKTFLIVNYILMGVVAVWVTVALFVAVFMCRPISAFWTAEGVCLDFKNFAIGYAIVNIVTDLAVWMVPIPMVWKLQLPTAQKLALTFIFALGLFDCGAALTRLLTSMLVLGSPDPTWDYVPGVIWSITEPSVGVMCACLPTIRVLLVAILPESWRRAMSSKQQRSDGSKWPPSGSYLKVAGPQNKSVFTGSHTGTDNDIALQLSDVQSSQGILVSKDVKVDEERTDVRENGYGRSPIVERGW